MNIKTVLTAGAVALGILGSSGAMAQMSPAAGGRSPTGAPDMGMRDGHDEGRMGDRGGMYRNGHDRSRPGDGHRMSMHHRHCHVVMRHGHRMRRCD